MEVSVNNQALTRAIQRLIQDSGSPAETMYYRSRQDDEYAFTTGNYSEDILRTYFGLEKDVLEDSPQIENSLVAKLIDDMTGRQKKKLLSTPYFGEYNLEPSTILSSEESQAITEAATNVVHQRVLRNRNFYDAIESIVKSAYLYPITLTHCHYRRQIDQMVQSFQNVDLQRLDELANTPDFQISEVVPQEPFMDPQTGAQVELFTVNGFHLQNNSQLVFELVPFQNIVLDTYATNSNNIRLVGQCAYMSREDIVDKYSPVSNQEKLQEVLEETNREDNNSKNIKVYDVCSRIIDDETKRYLTLRFVGIGESMKPILVEDVGVLQYVVLQLEKAPGSFTSRSIADRIAKHQDLLTELYRSLAIAAAESSDVQKVSTTFNTEQIIAENGEVNAKMLEPGEDFTYRAAPYPADVHGFLESIREDALQLSGAGTEFDVPAASGQSIYETVVADEKSASRMDSHLNTLAHSIGRLFEVAYVLLRRYESHISTYDATARQVVSYNTADWPATLQFISTIGYGRGNNTKEIVVFERLLQLQAEMLPLGLTDQESVLNAVMQYCKIVGVNNPEEYFKIVPQQENQEPSVEDKLINLETQKLELQNKKIESDTGINIEKLKLAQNKENFDQNFDLAKLQLGKQRISAY